MNEAPQSTSHTACCDEAGDVVSFVVQDGAHTLCFSKRALMQNTPFFRAFFAAHGTATCENTIVLRHVTAVAAEAALRVCHSPHHEDDALYRQLVQNWQRACVDAGADAMAIPPPPQRAALRNVLSLFETCVKFELHRHAHAVAVAVAAGVTETSVLDVMKTCARYASALPKKVRERIGLRALLSACRPRIPAAWTHRREERRWQRLCVQYPELPAMLLTASTTPTVSPMATARGRQSSAPPPLLSPLRDDYQHGSSTNSIGVDEQVLRAAAEYRAGGEERGTVCVSSRAVQSAAPLEDVFAHHLRQTEELALAAQHRRRAAEDDVAALRASEATLRERVCADRTAAAASTRYLGGARVYVQALRAAEADLCALGAKLESLRTGSAMTASPTPLPAAPHALASTRLHVLRHELQCAAETAVAKRHSIDDLLAMEEYAVGSLDEELALLQAESC